MLEGTKKVDLNSFKDGMKELAVVNFSRSSSGFDLFAKFDGWTQSHKIYHTEGNRILISAKAFLINALALLFASFIYPLGGYMSDRYSTHKIFYLA